MKTDLSSRGLFMIGFIVLVVTNIVVLSGVSSNRSGTPDAMITLTERELNLPSRIKEENSGLTLSVDWRALNAGDDEVYGYYSGRSPAWFTSEKLEELGFKMKDSLRSVGNKSGDKKSISKEVFIVLENNGEPYRESVKRAEKVLEEKEALLKLKPEDSKLLTNYKEAEKRLRRERMENSRLFAIDAGLDPGRLRGKYEDRTRFLIVKGQVKPGYHYAKKKKAMTGVISRLSIQDIQVPLKHRKVFDTVQAQNTPRQNGIRPPRYEVVLAYGKRFEPWIESVKLLEVKSE